MTATQTQIDWNAVRQRLARYQALSTDSDSVDQARLIDVFHQRALGLARRGRHETTTTSCVSVVVFRLGNERFGVPLADLKQVFPRVPITPIPGKGELLIGVANLNGTLRSVVDPRVVLRTSTEHPDDGYIILLRATGRSLALWVEALEGVFEIDLATLVAIDEVASGKTGNLVIGITESQVIVLDVAAVIDHVKNQLSDSEP